jgi:hypothetical protein
MSNEVYDEFCKASIPKLTQLDRQLLGHYCARFNEEVIPPRAWPPLTELERITGDHAKSISRSIGRLRQRGLLIRITLASKTRGKKAEYAINRPLLRSFIQVTEELPNTPLEVTEQALLGNSVVLVSNSPVPLEALSGYAKRIEPIKRKNVDTERFNEVILKGVPSELRSTVNAGRNIEELLNEAESLELSRNAIREHLNVTHWQNVNSAGAIVLIRLQELIAERKKQLALAEQVAENRRVWALEQAESERLKVSPERVDKYVNEALEAIRRNRS